MRGSSDVRWGISLALGTKVPTRPISSRQVIFSKSVGFQEPPEDLDDLSWARASLEAEQLTHFHAVVTDKGRIIGASSWRQSWRPQEQETEGLSAPLSLDATFKALSALIGAQHAAAALELAAVKGQPVYRAQVVYTGGDCMLARGQRGHACRIQCPWPTSTENKIPLRLLAPSLCPPLALQRLLKLRAASTQQVRMSSAPRAP